MIMAVIAAASSAAPAFAQTQPTRPTAYPTLPTMPSAFATPALNPCYPSRGYFLNPESSCFSGTEYPSYSALGPFEFATRPGPRPEAPSSANLNETEAKSRIESKGYLDISSLEKDSRGIWRGKATLKDGRPVNVTIDLEGNIYSTLSRLYIRIQPPPPNR